MISRKQIELIKNIDSEYIICGSSAVMLYVGHDIRKCRDLDVSMHPFDAKERLAKLGFIADVSHDEKPWQEHNGARLIKLEELISYKINRYGQQQMPKDLYDLYFLLSLPYDMAEVKSSIHLAYVAMSDRERQEYEEFMQTAFDKIPYADCNQRLNDSLKQILES